MNWLKQLLGLKGSTASPAPLPSPTPSRAVEFEGALQVAVDRCLRSVYGDQEPLHYGVKVYFEDGGPEPLHGVSAYWVDDGPHWHYVSFGLATLGFELTFRLAATPADRGDELQYLAQVPPVL